MRLIETEQFLFYTAGKICTNTLFSIPGANEPSPHSGKRIRSTAMNAVRTQKNCSEKQIVILIREPIDRFYSGLFEMLVKTIARPYIREIIAQDLDLSFLTNSEMWADYYLDCNQLISGSWEANNEFDGPWWQYHIGNWLSDADVISCEFGDTIILDHVNLSKFLNNHNITYTIKNKRDHFFQNQGTEFAEQVFTAFKDGINSMPKKRRQILSYLQNENEIYNRLLSRSLSYD